jgi:hypothetical protein
VFSGMTDETVATAELAARTNPSFMVSRALLIASYVQVGWWNAVRIAAQRLLEVMPSFTITMIEQMEFTAPERVAQY